MSDEVHKPGKRIDDETTIEATPEDIFEAWTTPGGLERWFVDESRGSLEQGELVWGWPSYGFEHTLRVVEHERGRRLVLETLWGDGTPTVIEVTLEPGDEGTRVRLVHSGFLDDGSWDGEYAGARSGWTNALASLKLQLERYPGRSKRTIDQFQPAVYRLDDVLKATRTSSGLAAWLGESKDRLDAPGDPVRIESEALGTITGEVIARTDWETTVTWEELEGALTFQAFPGEAEIQAGERMLGLRLVSWSEDPDATERAGTGLEVALAELVDHVSA